MDGASKCSETAERILSRSMSANDARRVKSVAAVSSFGFLTCEAQA